MLDGRLGFRGRIVAPRGHRPRWRGVLRPDAAQSDRRKRALEPASGGVDEAGRAGRWVEHDDAGEEEARAAEHEGGPGELDRDRGVEEGAGRRGRGIEVPVERVDGAAGGVGEDHESDVRVPRETHGLATPSLGAFENRGGQRHVLGVGHRVRVPQRREGSVVTARSGWLGRGAVGAWSPRTRGRDSSTHRPRAAQLVGVRDIERLAHGDPRRRRTASAAASAASSSACVGFQRKRAVWKRAAAGTTPTSAVPNTA